MNGDAMKLKARTEERLPRTLEPSHVLLAIGLKHEEAHGSMVLTAGRGNSLDQVPVVAKAAAQTVQRLRALSPL